MSITLTEARRERIRSLIASAGSRFASVVFVKKDRTERTMLVQPATGRLRVKGEAGSPSARQGAETRAQNHPHLLPIWDAGEQAFRSINLDTVLSVQVDGVRFDITAR
jgi:hypothetical protein